jgi:chemotaxis protein CheD
VVLKSVDQAGRSLIKGDSVDPVRSDTPKRQDIYLHPGKIFASSEACDVKTILGPCVAVCLWDPTKRIGGVAHFLLPYSIGNGQSSPKYGDIAIYFLIERILSLGSSRQDLKAKLFGGACVLDAMRSPQNTLGLKNIEMARSLLEEERIPIVADDVGGRRGRKLIFRTDDGSAWVKLL